MHSRMRHDRRFHTCSLVSSASSEKTEPTEGERHEKSTEVDVFEIDSGGNEKTSGVKREKETKDQGGKLPLTTTRRNTR